MNSNVRDASGGGPVQPVGMQLADTPGAIASSRLRVSTPLVLAESDHEYNDLPTFWETALTAGGTSTHLPLQSAVRMRVATSGDKVVRQSRLYHNYAGGSLLVFMAGLLGAATTNVRRRVGYFDAANGVFLEQTGTGASFVLRSSTSGSPVDVAAAQAAWNVDRLDGSGPSGITIDLSKMQTVMFALQWLSRIRCAFEIGGRIVVAHEFFGNNVSATPYTETPNLPERYEIEATGAIGGNADLLQVASRVIGDGGPEVHGILASASLPATLTGVSTTRRPIISLRPKATFGGKTNRGQIVLSSVEVLVGSGAAVLEMIYGGALTGASYASAGTGSIVEVDTSATAITGGSVVATFYCSGSATRGAVEVIVSRRLPLTLDIAGANPITGSLCAKSTTGVVDIHAALNWREVW